MGEYILPVILFGVIPALMFAQWVRGHIELGRHKNILDEDVDDAVCVACQGTQIEDFASRCHRCLGCGFIWGRGLRDYQATQRKAAVEKLAPRERRELALQQFRHAEDALNGAIAACDNADQLRPRGRFGDSGGLSIGDVDSGMFLDDDLDAETIHEQLRTAVALLGRAQGHMRHASEACELGFADGDAPLDFGLVELARELAWDANAASHRTAAAEIRERTSGMLAAVRRSRSQVQKFSP